ncbi:DUF1772 domain-containing protein [bacterium]|nr:DUF1772 domain-containing protein [bacterium]
MKEIQKRIFPFIIALSALSVSLSAAFYSVTGLSKLFAGASFQVLIMASSLEIAKLVIASLLYQYWGELNKFLRTYLTLAAFVLVLITSAGIYGFLSAAYQETAASAEIVDKEVELIDLKKGRFEENRTYYLSEKEALDQSISDLRAGLANNVIQYKDKETGQIITTTSSSTRRALQKELDEAVESRNEISQKLEVVTDSITSLEIKRLDVQSNSEVAAELGPLKYISELTNTPMSKVVNILMLVIIFVFDPLAISLVIAANFAFNRLRKKDNEEPQPKVKEPVDVDNEFSDLLDLQETKSENWSDDLPEEVLDEILAGEIFVVDNEKEPQPINPTDEDIEKLKEQLDKIENSKKEVSIEERPEETPKPQIKTLRYQPRDARNTRIDRI